ncbi:ImmA/IrrE family metallo-endopeptidase [Nocardia terpenica]|uniref:ImmA/IrrE family metallo-endopeptidase n=1 Tax=Nocardia terpenica TaxID=455432 RepID=A0A6G9YVH1_9NOCA|nr:ImmA/IrrE family metallo-endopeptidase [Nocardia terpenica]QIS17150.1 ImmA/IrrE family metallo-endopeptidase [Nocardia terpenica]
MDDASVLRKRCEEIARHLPIPRPFTAESFVAALAEYRGRRIELVGMVADRDTPCGLFVGTPDADYIFYASNTTVLHQEHIIAHEVGHIVCNHEGIDALTQSVASVLMKNLSSRLITRVLGRTVYSEAEEAEAEMLASVILIRAGRADPARGSDTELTGGLDRLRSVFG